MGLVGDKSPFLLFVAAPAAGHVNPLLQVASGLIKRGFGALFLSSPEFKDQITRAGAEWSDLEPLDMSTHTPEAIAALNPKMAVQIFAFAIETAFIPGLVKRNQQVREALEMLHRRDPARQVIVLHEIGAFAVHPFYFGAPLPNGYHSVPKTICLGVNPIIFDSIVIGPAGPGFPYEDTPAVRARNQYLFDLIYNFVYKDVAVAHAKKLQEAGCTTWPEYFKFDDVGLTSDTFFQLCGPSFEYTDPTRDPKVKFAGTLPPKALNPQLEYPPWWTDVTSAAKAGRKVVFLAQGTLIYSPEAVLLPVIRALENEPDVIVVAVIGTRGGSLPADFQVPKNTRVLDYFPYDAVLQYADVFIFNAGYGGAGHAIGNGVPIVVLGDLGQDKQEVAARIEWSGLGLAMRLPEPETAEIRTTVRKVLDDSKFKDRALELQKESKDLDPLATIEKQILDFAA